MTVRTKGTIWLRSSSRYLLKRVKFRKVTTQQPRSFRNTVQGLLCKGETKTWKFSELSKIPFNQVDRNRRPDAKVKLQDQLTSLKSSSNTFKFKFKINNSPISQTAEWHLPSRRPSKLDKLRLSLLKASRRDSHKIKVLSSSRHLKKFHGLAT